VRGAPLLALLTALAAAGCGGDDESSAVLPGPGLTVAVIGDTPYGDSQVANFPSDVERIDAQRDVDLVIHLGDIQAGPTRCTDAHLSRIRRNFDAFEKPVVYTPGDNEWTDCHQPNKGGHDPTERLGKLRSIFFGRPGRTLGGRPMRVEAQRAPFVENVRWFRAGTVFTTLHVPGSNNDLEPWFGAGAAGPEQREESRSRLRADLRWLDRAFDVATARKAVAVVVAMQADMWPERGSSAAVSGYAPIVARLAERARAFHRPVLVLQGDSHEFRSDRPLMRGSPSHAVKTAAPNLSRIVVQGAESIPHEWLRLDVYPRKRTVFAADRVPLEN
jgi:Calcineurin-like phosphoesterase